MTLVLFKPARLLLVIILGTFFFTQFSYASLPCGNIINDEDVAPISDCSDPFGVSSPTYPHTLKINGAEVLPNNEILISETGVADYLVTAAPHVFDVRHKFYLHDGDDYRLVPSGISEPEEADYYEAASGFFPEGFNSEPYVLFLLGDYSAGDEEGFDFDLLDDFEGYLNEQFPEVNIPLLPGTYTLVSEEILIFQTYEDSIFKKIRELFISTAWAQEFPSGPIHTLTFTLTAEALEPTGASSILFLPGIQASRLYTNGLLGTEDQLWEPNINNDLAALEMDEDGFSINDVYTKDVLDEVFGVVNVYSGFLDYLEELVEDEQIKDFLPFAYDWRFGVNDIVISGTRYEEEIKSVVEEIETLAEDSYTDKVTIIGHSNGGLLAKAIMVELEVLGKEDLVDKIVLVGSPQVGTPKAIGALLHGLDQQAGGGIITDDETAREVMKNMPGAYGLLPSKKYFELIDDVLIVQDDLPATAYLDSYADVTSHETLEQFLKGNHSGESINIPSALNADMVDRADSLHDSIDNWEAPEDIDVFEIAGVGIPTIKGFEYREFGCTPYLEGLGCQNAVYSKPYPVFTTYGDETVVATSALAYGGSKIKAEVDLFQEGEQFLSSAKKHANITESPTVLSYIDSVIKLGYQNETLEIPEDFITINRIYSVIGVHSPVDLIVSDEDGNQVGIHDGENFSGVQGGYVFTFGDSKYVIVPEGEYEVEIPGYASSTFSLTVDKLVGDTQNQELFLEDLPVSPESRARFTLGEEITNIYIDIDSDGEDDFHVDTKTGVVTNLKPEVVIEESLPVSSGSSGTRVLTLPKPAGMVAGATISIDREYLDLLLQLIGVIQEYLNLIEQKNI